MEKIVSEVANRLNGCSICHHPHRIAHLHRIPSDTELSQYSCHLKFNDYIGSFLDGDILVDVFAFPVSYHKVVLEIIDRTKREDEIEDDLECEYQFYQMYDEDEYEDW